MRQIIFSNIAFSLFNFRKLIRNFKLLSLLLGGNVDSVIHQLEKLGLTFFRRLISRRCFFCIIRLCPFMNWPFSPFTRHIFCAYWFLRHFFLRNSHWFIIWLFCCSWRLIDGSLMCLPPHFFNFESIKLNWLKPLTLSGISVLKFNPYLFPMRRINISSWMHTVFYSAGYWRHHMPHSLKSLGVT